MYVCMYVCIIEFPLFEVVISCTTRTIFLSISDGISDLLLGFHCRWWVEERHVDENAVSNPAEEDNVGSYSSNLSLNRSALHFLSSQESYKRRCSIWLCETGGLAYVDPFRKHHKSCLCALLLIVFATFDCNPNKTDRFPSNLDAVYQLCIK